MKIKYLSAALFVLATSSTVSSQEIRQQSNISINARSETSIFSKVCEIIANETNISELEIFRSSKFIYDLGISSIAFLNILQACSEEFDIDFSEGEKSIIYAGSVGDLCDNIFNKV
jgi:acyl carrier protein